MRQAAAVRRFQQGSIRLTSIAAASVVSLFALQPAAQAAVVYLDPCFACALNTTPPAGDEWVIQGNFVYTGVDSLSSRGALTNNASYFSNSHGLTVYAPFTNNKSFINSGGFAAYGAAVNNNGTFLNTGSMVATTQLNNNSGRFVNNGSLENYATITNKAVFTNGGSLVMKSGGSLTNEVGGTVENTGSMSYFLSSFTNKGTWRNRTGGQIQTSGVFNSGTLINEAGATINSSNSFVNASGSKLVNHGTIISGDSVFNLAAGSNYDFTGGKLVISNSLGRMYLNRDFTFGEARAGTVEIGYNGSFHNFANVQIAKGYSQTIAGRITNHDTGTITINANATLTTGDLVANNGKLTNNGTFKIGEALTGNNIVNNGTVELTGTYLNAGITGAGKVVQNQGWSSIQGGITASSVALNGGHTTIRSQVTANTVTVGAQGDVEHNGAATVTARDGVTVNGNYSFTGEGTVNGAVTNNGIVRVADGGKATFNGRFLNQSQLVAEGNSSTLVQGDLVISADGVIKAGNDTITVTGNLLNGSLQSTAWNTDAATLVLQGAGAHKLTLAGKDFGASQDGYLGNFALGGLTFGAGGQFTLADGNAMAGAGLYVGQLTLAGGLTQLDAINSPFNIYYNIGALGNEYLGGQTYSLNGGGKLIGVDLAAGLSKNKVDSMAVTPTAVPEPSAWALAMGGVLMTLWRRKARRAADRA